MNPAHTHSADTVLIVEDEEAIAQMLALHLRHAGWNVLCANSVSQAEAVMQLHPPAVILLDWMLPGVSGLEALERWRNQRELQHTAILMLTARADEADKIAGLHAGADDYITKPFSTRELLARVRSGLRRHSIALENFRTQTLQTSQNLSHAHDRVLQLGDLRLDPKQHRATWQGQALQLSHREFRLLEVLLQRAERVQTRSQLQQALWDNSHDVEERTVDVHIKRLRQALGPAAVLLHTVRGVGYRLGLEA